MRRFAGGRRSITDKSRFRTARFGARFIVAMCVRRPVRAMERKQIVRNLGPVLQGYLTGRLG